MVIQQVEVGTYLVGSNTSTDKKRRLQPKRLLELQIPSLGTDTYVHGDAAYYGVHTYIHIQHRPLLSVCTYLLFELTD
jgi:hypothetical protein